MINLFTHKLANSLFSFKLGVGSYGLAIALGFYNIRLSAIPLAIFVILCGIAPFLPRVSFFLPIISRGKSGKNAVALTFDDGPDPLTTPALLDVLATHHVKATFFVIGKKAAEYPELIKRIISDGHTIGNHSYHHDTLVMLKSYKRLKQEIKTAQDILKTHGIIPLFFRPPAGITNPKLNPVLSELNMQTLNFSCRAMDGGNRRIKHLAARILKQIQPDDIILLHDISPKDVSLFHYWLNEIDLIISGIKKMGMDILPLSEMIEQPVMN